MIRKSDYRRMKRQFIQNFRHRFALRFHMFAILVATASSGVLASKLLFSIGLTPFFIRYPLSVLLAYLVFFLCVKLWLIYIRPKKHTGSTRISDWLDIPNISRPGSGNYSGGKSAPMFRPGGGRFGGGGASSSFDHHTVAFGDHSGVVGEGLGNAAGEAVGALDGESGFAAIIVVAVLAALIAAILGSTIYIVYDAPVILAEAAFEGLLAASLIRGAKQIDSGDWVGSIFFRTWKPFLITFLTALAAGCVLNYYFPGASRIHDLLRRG